MLKLQEKAGPEPSDTELNARPPLDYNAKDPNYTEDGDGLGAFRGLISASAIVTALALFAISWIRDGAVTALCGFGCVCFGVFFWELSCGLCHKSEKIVARILSVYLVVMSLNFWGVW